MRSYPLSGSCTSLIECMNIALGWGVPREVVERAVTANPATFLAPALTRFGISCEEAPRHSRGVEFRGGLYVARGEE